MSGKLVAALATGTVLLVAAPAQGRQRPVLRPLIDRAPRSTVFQDRVITGATEPKARAAAIDGATTTYLTKDGTKIPITIASSFTGDPAVAQTYADFLDGLPHGSELAALRVTIAPASEIPVACGGQEGDAILACYTPSQQRMIVPGDLSQTASGVTASYVITHEYGHHVAAHRSNSPLDALAFGPKRWASYELVCTNSINGLLAPGNEGALYRANPGENWAETYARLVYPQQPWNFTGLLTPDAGALAAARADVAAPWTASTTKVFRGSFAPGGARSRSFTLPLTLDGAMTFALSGPRRSNYDLRVVSLGKVQKQTRTAGSTDRIHYDIACRERPTEVLTLTVQRRSGTGSFSLTARYAG